jgi:GNAT superfamily N-acetyltransferase
VQIREAAIGDAAGIAAVHVESWRAAYAGILPQDYLDSLEPVQRGAVWKRILSSQGGRELTVVAEDSYQIVGFANVCASRDADVTAGAVGEVAAIYLRPEVWGQGGGRQLMAAALAALVEVEFSEATLWVLEANSRARRFYEASGWAPDGAQKDEDIRGFPVHELRYRRRIP